MVLYERCPDVPHLTIPFTSGQPILNVAVGVSQKRQAQMAKLGLPVPNVIFVRGFVDTGASRTGVDNRVLHKLGTLSSPTGVLSVRTPSTGKTAHTLRQYDIGLVLVHSARQYKWCELLAVTGNDFSTSGFDVLIGRDVLAGCVLVYDGGANSFILAF